ncbi:hypothetical protein A3J32_03600 [Candidatus Saccharibacteria bacterium RIFCSPLOWO2_02_FULL_46_7]|nr:MAG: hypothetical protein A3J32_03600 [Candidatus Saccharibacteria bacterium RIFCSPLOWO2_02_FULL_46_7]
MHGFAERRIIDNYTVIDSFIVIVIAYPITQYFRQLAVVPIELHDLHAGMTNVQAKQRLIVVEVKVVGAHFVYAYPYSRVYQL